MPKISIIVPVYNVEKYIRRCLDSIVNQIFTDWECILVDDGSPDNAGKICDEYAEKDGRFRVFHQENQGVSAARNKGLDEARGEWINFVDSDDWVDDDYLTNLYNAAIEYDADMVIGGCKIVVSNKNIKKIKPGNGKMKIPNDFVPSLQSPWGKLLNMNFYAKNKILFPKGVEIGEDLFFNFLIIIKSTKIYGIDNTSYNYNRNCDSVLHNCTIKKLGDHVKVLHLIQNNLDNKIVEQEWYNVFLRDRKVYLKNDFIFALKEPDFKSWRNTFPEISWYVVKNAETFNQKVIFFLAYIKFDGVAKLLWYAKKGLKHLLNSACVTTYVS